MQNLVITNQGQELIAKLIAGTDTAVFTRICTSDYDYSSVNLEELTGIENIKQNVPVSAVSKNDITQVEVYAAVNNSELTTGYYVKAVGLYAENSNESEILYGVSIETSNPDYMPAFGGKTVSGISFKINTKVDNAEQVNIEINPAATPTIEQVEEIQISIETHKRKTITGENGIHGFRFFNGVLQFYNEDIENWVEIETGGSGIAPFNVVEPKLVARNQRIIISWGDPIDTVINGETVCRWKGTKLVYKIGGFPENIQDGILLVDNQERNAYKDNGFQIENLNHETVYYFSLFPYSDKKAVNDNAENRLSGSALHCKKMTVNIDLANSNPETCITYADDAVGMVPGSAEWDEFFGHYPVILENGVETGKLNPNDFSKFEDGTPADITTLGKDVMIAFPRKGLNISTLNNILTVSMTNDPDDNENFDYLAHSRGEIRKEVFYLGSYLGYAPSVSGTVTKLYSASGVTPNTNQHVSQFRTFAHNRGEGYENSGFYQLIFRQAMYLLKYKNLNSQSKIGMGYVSGSARKTTGGTNQKGMDYGETDRTKQMKLFGIEDCWGNLNEWVDGIILNASDNLLTNTTDFNDVGTGYNDYGNAIKREFTGYLTVPQGTSELGFLPKECKGSTSTYFCDYVYGYRDRGPAYVHCCGSYSSSEGGGMFAMMMRSEFSGIDFDGRLMYL